MIDEKKLVLDINDWYEKGKCLGAELTNEQLISHIIGLIYGQPQSDRWTPMTEKPPKETGTYIVTRSGYTWLANWFCNAWWDVDKKYELTDVEAWQPRPEPYIVIKRRGDEINNGTAQDSSRT